MVTKTNVRIEAMLPEYSGRVLEMAEALGLPQGVEAEFALQLGEGGLQLQALGPDACGPVRVDFLDGAVAHRRLHGGGSGQMIAKAVGIQSVYGRWFWTRQLVWDAMPFCSPSWVAM